MLCLLAATGELLKHNTLQARIVVQAIPRESRTVDIALNDAMDGNRHITLGIKIQVLLNLGCTHVLNDFSADFQVVTELLELALNFALISVREIRNVIRNGGNTGSLGKRQQIIKRDELDMLLRTLFDVQHCREPGDALCLERSFQLVLGLCGFEVYLRCDVR